MKKHNILFINRRIGFLRGGGEHVDIMLSTELIKDGHNVFFLIGSDTKGNISYPITHADCYIAKSPFLVNTWHNLPTPLNVIVNYIDIVLFENSVILKIESIIKENEIDVIQILGLPRLASKLEDKYPSIKIICRFPGPMGRLIFKKHLIKLKNLFAPGDAYTQIRKENKNIALIQNGIDRNIFKKINKYKYYIHNKYKINKTIPVLLSASRLVPLKNYSYALSSLYYLKNKIKKFKYLIVGEGAEIRKIKLLIRKFKLTNNVILVGQLKHNEIVKYYNSADIFILSSSYENYPNAVIEALACGLPTIATDVGGVSQIVKDGKNGYLVNSKNPKDLTNKIIKLLKNYKLRDMIKNNRSKSYSEYSWKAISKIYTKKYLNT